MNGSTAEGQSMLDVGRGQGKDGENRGGGMLRSPVAGGRSGGGGAKNRRFMEVVGEEDMKLVRVREDEGAGGGEGRIQWEAGDWLRPPPRGAARSRKQETRSSDHMH